MYIDNFLQKIKYLNLFKFINFIIIFTLNIIIFIRNNTKIKFNEFLIHKIENFKKSYNISDNDIIEFRKINSKNILLDKINYTRTKFPDISVILIIYNQEYCLNKALRSIQNQSIKNLEIIIVDDCSLDNSLKLLRIYEKEDNRIIIIKHDINEGKIKSRSDGIRLAKGKYITVLDGDDAFIHKDILYNSLFIANLGDLDIVEFKIIKFKDEKSIGCLNRHTSNNRIIYQPELRTKFFYLSDNYSYRAILNRNICGKLIKNIIFKKTINNIGPKYTEDYILRYEDTIMTVSLFQVAKSYYYLQESGYYYSKDDKIKIILKNNITSNNKRNIIKGMDEVKLLQFLIEKTKNNKIERQLIFHEIMSINYYSSFYKYINHDFQIVYNIFDKMIKSRFLSKNEKRILKLLKLILIEKENNLKKKKKL